MILLNYEKKKIVHVQCGLQVSTFWPSMKTQYAVGTCTY